MKIHTFTVVVGTSACQMRCPYCVSRMTPEVKLDPQPNFRNFDIACRFAEMSGVTTVLYTGKGEPTLYPDLITHYLLYIKQNKYKFPFQEIQTNGIRFDPMCSGSLVGEKTPNPYRRGHTDCAREWYDLGITLVCVSVAHYDAEENNRLLQCTDKSFNYWRAIDTLHRIGFSVRLNCTLVKGGVDNAEKLIQLMAVAKGHGVEQVTVRMVSKPDESGNEEVAAWVRDHQFDDSWVERVVKASGGVHLLNLPHGAKVYDWHGQNICLSTCLTETTDRDDIRQMIYFPNGSLKYSWSYSGAVIL